MKKKRELLELLFSIVNFLRFNNVSFVVVTVYLFGFLALRVYEPNRIEGYCNKIYLNIF